MLASSRANRLALYIILALSKQRHSEGNCNHEIIFWAALGPDTRSCMHTVGFALHNLPAPGNNSRGTEIESAFCSMHVQLVAAHMEVCGAQVDWSGARLDVGHVVG